MILSKERIFSLQREVSVGVVVFLMTALFFISLSVFATTVGTNIDATGTIGAATSTPWGDLAVDQVAGKGSLRPIFVVGDNATNTPFMFVSQKGVVSFGSSTPSNLFLNPGDVVIGRNGATSDLFVSGGLGVGNATTTDNNIQVAGKVVATGNLSSSGHLVTTGAGTSTIDSGGSVGGSNGLIVYANGDVLVGATTSPSGFVVEKTHTIFSSGADATTTLSVLTESTTKAGCIELTSSKGNLFRLYVVDETSSSSLYVQAGSCAAN